jgi:hypothetical protein
MDCHCDTKGLSLRGFPSESRGNLIPSVIARMGKGFGKGEGIESRNSDWEEN